MTIAVDMGRKATKQTKARRMLNLPDPASRNCSCRYNSSAVVIKAVRLQLQS